MMTMQVEKDSEGLEVLRCKQCGKEQGILSFYRYGRSENRFPICKQCLIEQLDIHNPDTFLWILKELDVPFVEYEWDKFVARYNNSSILGRYLSLMRLRGWKAYTWEHSNELNELHKKFTNEGQT